MIRRAGREEGVVGVYDLVLLIQVYRREIRLLAIPSGNDQLLLKRPGLLEAAMSISIDKELSNFLLRLVLNFYTMNLSFASRISAWHLLQHIWNEV